MDALIAVLLFPPIWRIQDLYLLETCAAKRTKKSLENHKTMVFQETFLAILYRVLLHSSNLAYFSIVFYKIPCYTKDIQIKD